jgi:Spy/CpxP family protein refolding chaperone
MQERQGGPGGGQGRQNELLFQGITLTEVQKARIDSIQAAGREAMRAQMQGGGMQDSTGRARMAEMRTAQFAEVRKVLTPEQVVTFDTNVRNLPAPAQGGRRPPTR